MRWLKSFLAGLAGVAFLLLSAYRSGKRRERERAEAQRMAEMAEAQGRRIDVMRKANEIKSEIDRLPTSDLDDRLRRWERKSD